MTAPVSKIAVPRRSVEKGCTVAGPAFKCCGAVADPVVGVEEVAVVVETVDVGCMLYQVGYGGVVVSTAPGSGKVVVATRWIKLAMAAIESVAFISRI
jgi:hypothetical protein